MEFWQLKPEPAGELGAQAVLDTSVHPPRVPFMHLDVTCWLGDDLVDCYPCYAVTPALALALRRSALSGFTLVAMMTTVSAMFRELQPRTNVPQFERLLIGGRPGEDDAGIDTKSYDLIVSDRCLSVVKSFSISHCEIARWRAGGG